MLDALHDLLKELYCSISSETIDEAKKALQDALSPYSELDDHKYFIQSPLDEGWGQGDIFSEIKFHYRNEKGEIKEPKLKGLLLSNTCDSVRNQEVLFAPIRAISDFTTNEDTEKDLKKNIIYNYMYIRDKELEDCFIDFGKAASFSRQLICDGITNKKLNRLHSLTNVGYYLFLLKLTIYFMRWEDKDFNQKRISPWIPQ